MKTVKQIMHWLQYNGYYKRMKPYVDSKNVLAHVKFNVNISHTSDNIIINGFLWDKTPQDNKYWREVHCKYRKWYGKR